MSQLDNLEAIKQWTILADKVAEEAHRGQTRKNNGEPYINHPRRVADRAGKIFDALRPIALLHDVLEDTPITAQQLGQQFPVWIVDAVVDLTRQANESYLDFILRVKKRGGFSLRVKLADLEDNMSDLKPGSLRDKYQMAKYILTEIP